MSYKDSTIPFDACCSAQRLELKARAKEVRDLMEHPDIATAVPAGEIRANIMLAFRHFEDGIMRLGKAIQAFDGGKSVYNDRDTERLKSDS